MLYNECMQVVLIAALTSDGFSAREKNEISTHWTSREDARWFAQKTKEIGLCVMGRTTYQTIGRPLPDRSTIILTSQPSLFETDHISSLDQISGPIPSLATSNMDPKSLVAELTQRNYPAVAICGGSSVYTQFMQAGLVNTLFLTIEPVIFGQGIKLFNESIDAKLSLIQTHHLSDQTIVQELAVVQ